MTSSGAPPNYYAILEIPENASTTQIRDAYKKAALKTHPDRVAQDSPERASRTRKFQIVNDAYYTLSDPSRRREYDAQRKLFGGSRQSYSNPFADTDAADESFSSDEPKPSGGTAAAGGGTGAAQSAYSWAWNYFTGQGADSQARQQTENAQFADVFEEMLREEGMAEPGTNKPTSKFWSVVGGLSGGAMGFIIANVPGMIGGALAGNRLGAVRDAKGKSVYSVFQELPQDERARLLTQLAAKVFSHAVGI
ncbi:DnaJ chaperone [Coniochaeta hoffmannii]|uniref:DnaJ chaperone n=1 Tax=Coniochaeta hoffmannii TaxID=91930 RepID=A0AA38VP72_9PEZI|nr:DnaJ chaperone [Coniochaeta hoffmannii]